MCAKKLIKASGVLLSNWASNLSLKYLVPLLSLMSVCLSIKHIFSLVALVIYNLASFSKLKSISSKSIDFNSSIVPELCSKMNLMINFL